LCSGKAIALQSIVYTAVPAKNEQWLYVLCDFVFDKMKRILFYAV
jgi:hypothetical protein